jgi:hypothetical protein
LEIRRLKDRLERSFFDDPEEFASAIEDALVHLNIGQWLKVCDEWIRRLRQCIHGGGEKPE